jgi:hypothetical protein
MIFRPINPQRYPCTLRLTVFGFGVLNCMSDPPSIVREFDTENEAWAYIKKTNELYWLEFEAQRTAYWIIERVAGRSRRIEHASPMLKAFLRIIIFIKRKMGIFLKKSTK